jgi:hypothetical protein
MAKNEWSYSSSSVITLQSIDRDNSAQSFNGQERYSVLLYSMCHRHAVISFRILLKMR